MRIELLLAGIGSDENAQLRMLTDLAFYHRRYDLVADLLQDGIEETLGLLPKELRSLLKEAFVQWVEGPMQSPDMVVSVSGAGDHFSLTEALAFLSQNFEIVLENSNNDSYFVEAISRNFKKRSKKIERFKKNHFLEFGNAGGVNNIENYLARKMRNFEFLPKIGSRYLRAFVLLDSDKSYPGEAKPEREALIGYLKQHNIPFHILEKREMENYLPDAAFSEVNGDEEFILAYLRLTSVQKDYFDIEKGFPDRNRDSPFGVANPEKDEKNREVVKLYESVENGDFEIFRKKNLGLAGFKSEFPILFSSDHVTQASMLSRVADQRNPNELADILDAITKAL
jgi:hypothetical protein